MAFGVKRLILTENTYNYRHLKFALKDSWINFYMKINTAHSRDNTLQITYYELFINVMCRTLHVKSNFEVGYF
jgi:hypothetical protein